MTAVCSDTCIKHINALCVHKAEVLIVTNGGP